MNLDRSIISTSTRQESENSQFGGYLAMSQLERMELVTYLRESFYGEAASTGRLQRVFNIIKRT